MFAPFKLSSLLPVMEHASSVRPDHKGDPKNNVSADPRNTYVLSFV
jgi:hypothetical protein